MKRNVFYRVLMCAVMMGSASLCTHAQNISTFAGCGIGDDSAAKHAELFYPYKVAFDTAGNAYIADAGHYLLRKVTPSGIISTYAGNGTYGNTGDGGAATSASVGILISVAADKHGNVYMVDENNNCVRKIDASGIITTFAGTGAAGFSGDGGLASAAKLNFPTDIAIDTAGNIFIADWQNVRVRKINTAGIISTVAGTGFTGTFADSSIAATTSIGKPYRIALDRFGNMYIGESNLHQVCKMNAAGYLTTVAGDDSTAYSGDGVPATTAAISVPSGLATDAAGNLYISDITNQRIRKVDAVTGIISTVAGTGIPGFNGDGGFATASQLSNPEGLTFDAAGHMYISEAGNNRIREMSTAGTLITFAGQSGLFEDSIAAKNAEMGPMYNVAADSRGNVYTVDFENGRIRKVNTQGIITTAAGSGVWGPADGYGGDGGPALNAQMYYPMDVAVDTAGNMYIADEGNNRIRKVDTAGIITTIAGSYTIGYTGDGGPATAATFTDVSGIAVDKLGNIYVADDGNGTIRKIDTAGMISTVAGTGTPGFSGDHGLATAAQLNHPYDVAVDNFGNIYVSDQHNNCIRKIDGTGIITTLTDTAAGFSGDGGPASSAQINDPQGIKTDSAGNVYFADAGNQRIRKISMSGTITTIAGTGTAGYSGDGGPSTAAKLNAPSGVAIDPSGNMYIADYNNFRIRKIANPALAVGNVNAVATNVFVYPNPAHDRLVVSTAASLNGSGVISLFNTLGQQVYTVQLLQSQQTIDISNLVTGIYVMYITDGAGSKKTFKIVKE